MMEELVYICLSKYGKYKQQCKFNLEQVASAAMVRDKYVQLLLTKYATREKMFSLLQKIMFRLHGMIHMQKTYSLPENWH
jgi:hypothetical protein